MDWWDLVVAAVLIWLFVRDNRLTASVSARLQELEHRLLVVEHRLERSKESLGPSEQPEAVEAAEPWEAAPAAPTREAVSASAVSAPAVTAQPAPPPAAFALPKLSSELEVVIGTSWLNRIGIVAIVVAAAFFLKYSFDNNWIGAGGRVALTSLFGLALLVAGDRYARRKLALFGQALTGGGLAVLFFSAYTAFAIYELIGFTPAFGLMVLITVASVVLALRHQSIVVASLGLLAGFATPLLLGDRTGGPAQPVTAALYLYFLLLTGAAYVVARRTGWWRFGVIGLAAGFLTPAIVGTAATPNAPAALAYFLVLSVGALLVGAAMNIVQLAWAAIAGAVVFGWVGGAGPLLETQRLLAFGYFGVIGIGAAVVAWRQNWPILALVATSGAALLGGLSAMGLSGVAFRNPQEASVQTAVYFVYLAALALAAIITARRRNWQWVDIAASGAVALAAASAAPLDVVNLSLRAPGSLPLPPLSMFVQQYIAWSTGLFIFLTGTLALRSAEWIEQRLLGIGVITAVYAVSLYRMLGGYNRDALAIAAVGCAAYFVLLSQVVLRRRHPQLGVYALLGLAVTFLTIAVPLKLRQEAIPLAWSIEGVMLAWAAARTRNRWAGQAATVIGIVAVARLIVVETYRIADAGLIFTGSGLAFAVGITGLVLEALYLRRVEWKDPVEEYVVPAFFAGAAGLLLWWGAWEINGVDVRSGGALAASGAKQALLSAWFTVYGFALIIGGIWKKITTARWAGIGLLAVTALKVAFVDLAQVAVVYRILSLAVLGGLLLLASLAYTRYRSRLGRADASTAEGP